MLRLKMLSVLAGVTLVLVGIDGLEGIEVGVPERYLRPRDYNPHPLQTLLASAQPLNLLLDRHPYQLYSRPRPRPVEAGGGDSSPVQFPAVPEAAKPSKSDNPGYITVPKNYAFSYAVKDRQSGDDFSHQQAHNGQATKGEYRVKLPDGRTQIVSYTADNSGYKADVRYDGIANQQPLRPSSGNVYYRPSSSGYGALTNSILQDTDTDYPEEAPEVVYKQPVRLLHKQNALANQYLKATPTPRPLEVLFSPTPQPYKSLGHAPLYQPVQFRALPQTAAEYTSSDAPYYAPVATATPARGYYGGGVSSTPATPIMEDQDDVPAPRKPAPISSYYSGSSPAPPSAVRYVLVPQHAAHYDYSDS